MNIWLAISFVLAVVSVYLFVIEAFSVAFKLTGMATKKIRFQVASLFTSSGFTTSESELITNKGDFISSINNDNFFFVFNRINKGFFNIVS